jgi:hypothetical protein
MNVSASITYGQITHFLDLQGALEFGCWKNSLLCFLWTRMSCRLLSLLNAAIGGFGNISFILSEVCNSGRCFRTNCPTFGSALENVNTKGILSVFSLSSLYCNRSLLFLLSTLLCPHFEEEGVYCFALVGPSRPSVRRPNGFRVITKEPLGLGTSNLVCKPIH